MQKKITKPTSCKQCPVIREEKGMIRCGCDKSLTAKTPEEKMEMWHRCPIDWDKE